MGTGPTSSTTLTGHLWRRSAAIAATILLGAGGLVLAAGGSAAAAPQPTISQVEAQLAQLNTKAQQLDQQYAAAQAQLDSANAQLQAINNEIARYQTRFKAMRAKVAQIAAAAYENGSLDAPTTLLTSNSPQKILNQASILEELSSSNSNQMAAFLTAARQLASAQAAAKRIQSGKQSVVSQLQSAKDQNDKLIAQQKQLLAQLSPVQAATVAGATGPSDGNNGQACTKLSYSGGNAAVAFAYQQLCCPYVFGGTGPCSAGFDCSGLTQGAWANAGVSIPRTSYDQMSGLPSVSTSELQPGDILGFAGNSHVAIYVGDGYLIDAPQTGEVVEKVPLSGWFASELDGAVRP